MQTQAYFVDFRQDMAKYARNPILSWEKMYT